eukprot:CAMPEP_0115104982 /NCGR_PEP_ID=MMETSP0227-20121206/35684_1 /TAXON_ID=89957 /ORGANISM="Polarella glacialis, Strain CCMP 1383" /LENGTH=208 /DNA_ID=CAMNT_0002502093 /DNA_START=45 /DNA_END=671 /DNA_ORIENTATION=-
MPAQIVAAATAAGASKVKLGFRQMIGRGALSGALLGVSTSFAITVWTQPFGKELPVLGAFVFPVGFCMLVLLGLELVTGNFCVIPMAFYAGRTDAKGMLKNWFFVTLGNLIGSVLYAAWFYAMYSEMGVNHGSEIALKTKAIAMAKTVAFEKMGVRGWFVALLKGAACNWMVTMGVMMNFTSASTVGRIAAMWMPITMFFLMATSTQL